MYFDTFNFRNKIKKQKDNLIILIMDYESAGLGRITFEIHVDDTPNQYHGFQD